MYSSHQEDDEHYNHSAPEFGMHSKQFDNLFIILSIHSNSARNVNDFVLWKLVKVITNCAQRNIGKTRKRIFLLVIPLPNNYIKDTGITSI